MTDETRRVRRVLYDGDLKPDDYLAALAEVKAIRSDLSRLRHRLCEVGKAEAIYQGDSLAEDAAGAITTLLVALYTLESGTSGFKVRADQLRQLWENVAADPDEYVIKPGMSPERAKRGVPAFGEQERPA